MRYRIRGNFCPECGTQWLKKKHCPQCGATLAGSTKFCNNCGYSFVESAQTKGAGKASVFFAKVGAFFKKVWTWIRSRLKIIIPTACALVAVIVVCSLIPTFIAMGVNGTYYAYSFDDKGEIVYSEKDYITLSSGKWKDSDGNQGKYSRSGKNVTLTYRDQAAEDLGDIMGDLGVEVPTEIKLKAIVVNGVMTITDGVTWIGPYAFYYCRGLTSFQFNGTKEQWNAIEKGDAWMSPWANCTVQCTDGKLPE